MAGKECKRFIDVKDAQKCDSRLFLEFLGKDLDAAIAFEREEWMDDGLQTFTQPNAILPGKENDGSK